MNKQLGKLIAEGIDIEMFYCIRLYKDFIMLQGQNSPKVKKSLEKIGFVFFKQEDWIVAKDRGIDITLTN